MMTKISPLGTKVGEITSQVAEWTGLKAGTALAAANVDAHVSVPAATVIEAGRMVMIMGTSICHMVVGESEEMIPGICGVVQDGILPNLPGYEAGQSCVGDHFRWFIDSCVPVHYENEARTKGIDLYQLLEEKATILKPGASGLLALDWWNGNRSVLVDADLTGMILGMTLLTKPEDIYRALIEATAFGTRLIIENFQHHNVLVREIIASGGLPDRNKLLMQIYSDVTGLNIFTSAATQIGAVGSAMHGAVAAGVDKGGYDTIFDASRNMARLGEVSYKPVPENKRVYDRLFAEYKALHNYFGSNGNDVMKRLKILKTNVLSQS
jgi:L-ribulokinase